MTSCVTTNARQRARAEEANRGEGVLEEEATTLKTAREGRGRDEAFWRMDLKGLTQPPIPPPGSPSLEWRVNTRRKWYDL